MRCPRTRTVHRRVAVPSIWCSIRWASIAVGPYDWRMLIALAELDADREILWAILLDDPFAESTPGGVRVRALVLEAGRQQPAVHDAGAAHAQLRVANAHGP